MGLNKLFVVMVVLALLAAPVFWWLDFRAYKHRFPEAPTWTYFFQGGK